MAATAARDLSALLAENAAMMDSVRSTTICKQLSEEAPMPPSVPVPAPVPRRPSPEAAAFEEMRAENSQLRSALDEANKRSTTIAELQRRQTDMHMTLLRAAHDEAVSAQNTACNESATLREQLTRASGENDALRRQLQRQQQTAQAELGILTAEVRAANQELVGSRDSAYTASVAGVHLAALRNELASSESHVAELFDALQAKATFHYTAPRGRQPALHDLRQWINGEAPAPPTTPAAKASPASQAEAGPLSSGALERLNRLEQVADAAAERFEALQKEHVLLRRKYHKLKLKQREERVAAAGASLESQATPVSELSPVDRRRRLEGMAQIMASR